MTTADSALELDPSLTSMHIRIPYARAGEVVQCEIGSFASIPEAVVYFEPEIEYRIYFEPEIYAHVQASAVCSLCFEIQFGISTTAR